VDLGHGGGGKLDLKRLRSVKMRNTLDLGWNGDRDSGESTTTSEEKEEAGSGGE